MSLWNKFKETLWEETSADQFWREASLGSLLKKLKVESPAAAATTATTSDTPATTLPAFCAKAEYLLIYLINPNSVDHVADNAQLQALVAAYHQQRHDRAFEIVTLSSMMRTTNASVIDCLGLPWPRLDAPTGETSYQYHNKRALLRRLRAELGTTRLAVVRLGTTTNYTLLSHNALPKFALDVEAGTPLASFPYADRARCELLTYDTLPKQSHRRKYPETEYAVIVFAGNDQQACFNRLAPVVDRWLEPDRLVLIAGKDAVSRKYWSSLGGRFGRYNEMDNGPVLALLNVDGDGNGGENDEDISFCVNSAAVKSSVEDDDGGGGVDEAALRATFAMSYSCTRHGQLQVMCRPGNCFEMHGLQETVVDNTYCHVCQYQQRLNPTYFACKECRYRECIACHQEAVRANAVEDAAAAAAAAPKQ